MTDLRKAAEMALGALLEANNSALMELSIDDAYSDEITALRQALAQPEQEKESAAQTVDPRLLLGRSNNFTKETENRLCDIERRLAAIETQPALAQPEQEDFAPYTGAGEASKIKHSLKLIPEQKPVAWFVASKFENQQVCWFFDSQDDAMLWSAKNLKIGVIKPLYTAPPKREWVGLTDKQIEFLKEFRNISITHSDFRAIEAVIEMNNNKETPYTGTFKEQA